MKYSMAALACVVVIGCGGTKGADSQNLGGPNPGGNTQGGTVTGTAQAATSANGATAAGAYSCANNAITDSTGTAVATCTGPVYNTCSVCPLTNGASCVSSTPVCQGTLTLPDGQTIAFSSNGCNEVTCSAAMTNGFDFHIRAPSGTLDIHLTDISSSSTFSNQSSASAALTWDGFTYSSKQNGPAGSVMFSGAQASPGSAYTLKVTMPLAYDTGTKFDQLTASLTVSGLITDQF